MGEMEGAGQRGLPGWSPGRGHPHLQRGDVAPPASRWDSRQGSVCNQAPYCPVLASSCSAILFGCPCTPQVHGSAPDIAGQDIANPLAMILSAAMMCRYGLHIPEVWEQGGCGGCSVGWWLGCVV